jgi:hypothetical protein
MRLTMIAVLGLALALSASPAFAFGGGGGHHDAIAGGGAAAGSSAASSTGSVAVTSEPLALLSVGLGLLGARFLRRR